MTPDRAERPLTPLPLYAVADSVAALGALCGGGVRRSYRQLLAAVGTAA